MNKLGSKTILVAQKATANREYYQHITIHKAMLSSKSSAWHTQQTIFTSKALPRTIHIVDLLPRFDSSKLNCMTIA
jgi:hypothetical protein